MTRYVWRSGQFVNKQTGEPMECPDRVACPQIASDIKPYKSVVSNKVIDGRADRREDLKRNNCRELDPSEGPKYCRSEKWARRLGLEQKDLSAPRLADQL